MVAHPVQNVKFLVKDNDILGAELIGVVKILVQKIISGNAMNDWFPIIGQYGNCLKPYLELHIPIQYKPIGNGDILPEIELEGRKLFQPSKCWEDICHAILEAYHMLCIIGWTIFHPVKLVREPTKQLSSGGELSLGALLKYKSQKGLRVVMMI
ncbi:hypothetical protein KIW84_071681 [Lathyrus oleraceus]|uniref:Uncharacterized protein n=1 Tax=Pisum sativum TaxID=3888 RepID=A0A9D4VJP1_PEA|nr:hypothetical protein KIW84_071681 [Pisum sativum]